MKLIKLFIAFLTLVCICFLIHVSHTLVECFGFPMGVIMAAFPITAAAILLYSFVELVETAQENRRMQERLRNQPF